MKAFGLATILIGVAIAANAKPSPLEQWSANLSETSALLEQQDFASAQARLLQLTREMVDQISRSGSADRLLAIALGQLAVADAGVGDAESAVWNWQIAQNIDPAVKNVDLSRYGPTEDLLRANLLPVAPGKCTHAPTKPSPAVAQRVEPKYPRRAREASVGGLVIVEFHLDAAGRPVQPQVISSPLSALTYSTLIALREWRFAVSDSAAEREPFCRLFQFGPQRRK